MINIQGLIVCGSRSAHTQNFKAMNGLAMQLLAEILNSL